MTQKRAGRGRHAPAEIVCISGLNASTNSGSATTGQAGWSARISCAWRNQLAAIFETGRLLIAAKAALPHGSFIAMLEAELPFKRRTAQMLMAIAADPKLSKAQHVAHLPPSWSTLYELTRLSDSAFEVGIASGVIHPEMDRRDVHGFIRTSGNWNWYSPARIIDPVRQALGGIDFDPCSCAAANETVRAKKYFTEADDGLAQEWPRPARIFMNPPYGHPLLDQFVDRFLAEIRRARGSSRGIVLVNSATETGWYHALLADASAICFVRGRIEFIAADGSPRGSPLQGQTLFGFGVDAPGFCTALSSIGMALPLCPARSEADV